MVSSNRAGLAAAFLVSLAGCLVQLYWITDQYLEYDVRSTIEVDVNETDATLAVDIYPSRLTDFMPFDLPVKENCTFVNMIAAAPLNKPLTFPPYGMLDHRDRD